MAAIERIIMKKGIIKGVIVLSVFLMALITISNIMNQGNTDMTIEMAQAVYPVVSVDYNGYSLNQMHGYAPVSYTHLTLPTS